jgi:tellurite resistance protein TerC
VIFEVSTVGWTATLGLIGALIAFDLWHSRRSPHAIALREAAGWSAFYVGIALLFGVTLAMIAGWDVGTQYFAGYVVEKSLSLDNLFVFVVIMATFAVPAEQQARLLMIGIVGALLLRAALIAVGAAMLDAFSFTYLLFGTALMATAVQLFRHRDHDPAVDDNPLIAAARRRGLPPTLLALVAIATTDILFALDSIPAVFGVTDHAYIVFVANAFALLGLRALFFLVSGLLDRLVYLSTGLATILGFIGVKLVLHFAHGRNDAVPEISTEVSLVVIAAVLTATAIASLAKARRDPSARAHAGSLRHPHDDARSRSTPASATSPTAPALTSPPGFARRTPISTSKRKVSCSLHSAPQLHE